MEERFAPAWTGSADLSKRVVTYIYNISKENNRAKLRHLKTWHLTWRGSAVVYFKYHQCPGERLHYQGCQVWLTADIILKWTKCLQNTDWYHMKNLKECITFLDENECVSTNQCGTYWMADLCLHGMWLKIRVITFTLMQVWSPRLFLHSRRISTQSSFCG